MLPALYWTFHVTQGSHFPRQMQYLPSLADESCFSAHCTGRSICDADQSCGSCLVAGAKFGERTFHMSWTIILLSTF